MIPGKQLTWQSSKRKKKQAHFMESETRAFCGRPLVKTKALGENWDPEAHPDCRCPTCYEWWRRVAAKGCKTDPKSPPS